MRRAKTVLGRAATPIKPAQCTRPVSSCALTALFLLMLAAEGCRIFNPSSSSGIPEVQIVDPSNGDTLSAAYQTIRVQVQSGQQTTKVRFFDNNLFLGEDYNTPFEHVWEIACVSSGQHELYAEVVDASGNVGRSATVTVFVSKGGLFDWQAVLSPTSNDLFAISGIDEQTIRACGANGALLKYEGSEWIQESLPVGTDDDLFDVSLTSAGRGWSVGDNILLGYENGSWSVLLSFSKKQLRSLFSFDESSGWVGDGDGRVYTFDGDTIIEYAILDTAAVTDILGISPQDVWASCGRSIHHFNGAMWVRDTTFASEEVHGLFSLDGITIWGAGTSVFRYDGTRWEVRPLPVLNGTAYGITLLQSETGIICGERQGKGFAFSFEDTVWTEMSLQRDVPLYSILGLSSGDRWIVGGEGTIMRGSTR